MKKEKEFLTKEEKERMANEFEQSLHKVREIYKDLIEKVDYILSQQRNLGIEVAKLIFLYKKARGICVYCIEKGVEINEEGNWVCSEHKKQIETSKKELKAKNNKKSNKNK